MPINIEKENDYVLFNRSKVSTFAHLILNVQTYTWRDAREVEWGGLENR